MEYMVGGDFLALLLRWDILPEEVARFYVAEMILCIEEAHRMNWIHRDVKPDNFLISASGHLKISDFGLAFDGHWSHNQTYYNETRSAMLDRTGLEVEGDAQDVEEREQAERSQALAIAAGNGSPSGHNRARPANRPEGSLVLDQLNGGWKRKMAKSVVGTSQYMAPEVIQGGYYDGRCDWWSIGIILFECLYGFTPFYCENREETKAKILCHRGPLQFPPQTRYQKTLQDTYEPLPPVSSSATHLIDALLSPREKRLCSRRYRENDNRGRRSASRNGTRCTGPPQNAFFVFDNDAEDVKRHLFFHGVDWNRLHLQRPPFEPRVRENQPITKYFDEELEIMGTSEEDLGSQSTLRSTPDLLSRYPHMPIGVAAVAVEAVEAAHHPPPENVDSAKLEAYGNALSWVTENEPRLLARLQKSRRKLKKRARDKILRDPKMGPTAIEVRKASAFLGYTYRRVDFTWAYDESE